MGLSQAATFTSGTLHFEHNVAIHGGGLKLLNSAVVRGGGWQCSGERRGRVQCSGERRGRVQCVVTLVAKMQ